MKMIEVKILGIKLEAPFLNPKTARKYENGIKEVVATANNALQCESRAEGIEIQCNAVIGFIDDVFGLGSARKVLGDETDLLTCLEAWRDAMHVYQTYVNPALKALVEEIPFALSEVPVSHHES